MLEVPLGVAGLLVRGLGVLEPEGGVARVPGCVNTGGFGFVIDGLEEELAIELEEVERETVGKEGDSEI